MKSLLAIATGILFAGVSAHGMATSRVGPDSLHGRPTVEQGDWPKGIVAIPRHESRVFSVWVNGNENFYFKANLRDINEMIALFSLARMRDHELILKQGTPKDAAFMKQSHAYNVNLQILAGISLGYVRGKEIKEAKTHEPKLTIHLTPKQATDWAGKINIPENIILSSEFDAFKSSRKRPQRNTWFTEVQFDNGKPAVDFSKNVQTRVSLWTQDSKQPIYLGGVSYKGEFHAPFSDEELAQLATGGAWLTMTTGNWSTAVKPDHPRLKVTDLYLNRDQVKAIQINRPGFLHGRLLFDDGKPPVLNPKPWPGARIKINFSYAGPVNPDTNGYFQIYFTPEQLEQLKGRQTRRNIYVPLAQKGRSKAKAGVVKIPRPSYN
ncbi:MAG: hypothetical protein ACPGVU_21760 [Limisphaerales bacterium]